MCGWSKRSQWPARLRFEMLSEGRYVKVTGGKFRGGEIVLAPGGRRWFKEKHIRKIKCVWQ